MSEQTELHKIWFLLMFLIISWWNILNSKKLQATVLIYKIQQFRSTRQKIDVCTWPKYSFLETACTFYEMAAEVDIVKLHERSKNANSGTNYNNSL